MPDLYEKLYLLHQQWQEDNLPEKPMWPRIMDKMIYNRWERIPVPRLKHVKMKKLILLAIILSGTMSLMGAAT